MKDDAGGVGVEVNIRTGRKASSLKVIEMVKLTGLASVRWIAGILILIPARVQIDKA